MANGTRMWNLEFNYFYDLENALNNSFQMTCLNWWFWLTFNCKGGLFCEEKLPLRLIVHENWLDIKTWHCYIGFYTYLIDLKLF